MHNSAIETSPSGVAFGFALLQELQKVTWLSKRIILVIHDGGSDRDGWDYGMNIGAKRWIDMYMQGDEPPISLIEELFYGVPKEYEWTSIDVMRNIEERTFKRSGSIFAMLGLDLSGGEKLHKGISLGIIGYNGLTPNMDYLNIIGKTHGGNIGFSSTGNHIQNLGIREWFMKHVYPFYPSRYIRRMSTLCQFMFDLAMGPSQGAHSHFLGYAIPGYTLGPEKDMKLAVFITRFNKGNLTIMPLTITRKLRLVWKESLSAYQICRKISIMHFGITL